jgi:hypothetical protein
MVNARIAEGFASRFCPLVDFEGCWDWLKPVLAALPSKVFLQPSLFRLRLADWALRELSVLGGVGNAVPNRNPRIVERSQRDCDRDRVQAEGRADGTPSLSLPWRC